VLLPDERGAQEVVDAAVQDGDLGLADPLAVDHPRDIRTGGAHQVAAGLQEQPNVAHARRRRPGRDVRRHPASGELQ
jgi:hypothetical protein